MYAWDGTNVGTLRQFRNLKRLGLPAEFIFPGIEHSLTPWDCLPPSLRELQIEVRPSPDWLLLAEIALRKILTTEAIQLLTWIDFLLRGISSLPNLKIIALWELWLDSKPRTLSTHFARIGNIMNGFEDAKTLFDLAMTESVEFLIERSKNPPPVWKQALSSRTESSMMWFLDYVEAGYRTWGRGGFSIQALQTSPNLLSEINLHLFSTPTTTFTVSPALIMNHANNICQLKTPSNLQRGRLAFLLPTTVECHIAMGRARMTSRCQNCFKAHMNSLFAFKSLAKDLPIS